MLKVKILLVLTFSLVVAPGAFSATAFVEFIENDNPGEYDVYAQVYPDGGDVAGLAGFDFEINDPLANTLTWVPSQLSGYDEIKGEVIGFKTQVHGIVGDPATSTRFAVGAAHVQHEPSTFIHGIGMSSISIPTLPHPIVFGPSARLGTLQTSGFLDSSHIVDVNVLLFPAGGGPFVPATSVSWGITIVEGKPFHSDPDPGETLDFGRGAETRTLQLKTYDGFPFASKVVGAEIVGEDAAMFSVTPFEPYDFVDDEVFNVDVHFNGSSIPGNFSASLALSVDYRGGGQVDTIFYPLVARVAPVPEPASLFTCLLLLGTIGWRHTLQRSHRSFDQ